eukprot:scaffold166069_cov42-Prasinocladus_malaysianus.AAC.1
MARYSKLLAVAESMEQTKCCRYNISNKPRDKCRQTHSTQSIPSDRHRRGWSIWTTTSYYRCRWQPAAISKVILTHESTTIGEFHRRIAHSSSQLMTERDEELAEYMMIRRPAER